MKTAFTCAALLASMAIPAFAGQMDERTGAMALCRSAIAAEFGLEATEKAIDFQESRTTPRLIKLRFNINSTDNKNWTTTCDVKRGALVVTKLSHGADAPLKLAQPDTK